ncbi:unnamed protein product [Coregonus sp. 'balchen']|nr:unnamed protein product [Coregonus sp. 'balchen']
MWNDHASNSTEEKSAPTSLRLGIHGHGGSVGLCLQRTVYGVDLETDAGPVPVLKNTARPIGAVTKESVQKVGEDGLIKGWTDSDHLNMSKAVKYNADRGTFTVERTGVYFLYCQVLFNENQSQLVKLDVAVVRGSQRLQRLQCMEGYGTTPAAGSHQFHFLKPCQVSGLLRLEKGVELIAITGPTFSLHITGKHYFGLFKVN